MNGDIAGRSRRGRSALVALGMLGGVLVGCGSDTGGSPTVPDEGVTTKAPSATGAVFTDPRFGINFRYPKDWQMVEVESDPDLTAGGRATARVAVGFDDFNALLLSRFDLTKPVTSVELPDQVPELNGIIAQFAGRPMPGTVTEIDGLPAVRYEEFPLPADPDQRSSRVVFLFDGDLEYQLNCQSTPEGRDQVNQACDQMLTTLRRK